MPFQGLHRIVVLGAGESGLGAALLARKLGLEVFVSDGGSIKAPYKMELMFNAIPYEENGHTADCLLKGDLMVKSPGIPDTHEMVLLAVGKGIPVISELEWAWMACRSKVIAITGSNGKTTTSSLIHHILSSAGISAKLGGNIGTSFSRLLTQHQPEWWVLEVSSFQLDGIRTFRPDIAILLNITPDHLDRYSYSFDRYAASKMRITMNQRNSDALIYWGEDKGISKLLGDNPTLARRFPFGWDRQSDSAAWVEENRIYIQTPNNQFDMTLESLALQGRHNVYNSMAAGIASRLLEIRKESLRQSFSDFQGITHRLEKVASVRGVDFINDSKATNVNSVWYALESMNRPVIWIAGGIDKGNDYADLKDLVKRKVKALICLGSDNGKLIEAFAEDVDTIISTQHMAEAVRQAYRQAEPGDQVLMSPACASFDLFENYEDRGEQFKRAVREL
jgi:UDP-N-acetylmuramoylalanine--D-glutamate ligase